jgi:multicomponent Na+:H+ antiporter subunit F
MTADLVVYTLNLTLAVLGITLILTSIRLFKGPSLPDRVVALDMISSQAVSMIAVYCMLMNESVYIRDAIVLAIVSFLGTVAFAYYVGKKGMP